MFWQLFDWVWSRLLQQLKQNTLGLVYNTCHILCAKIKMIALIQQQSKSDFTILLDTNHNFSLSVYIQKPADESIIRWKVVY